MRKQKEKYPEGEIILRLPERKFRVTWKLWKLPKDH